MTRRIELRLTPQMYDSLRADAQTGGYRSLPKYVRDRLFHARRSAARGSAAPFELLRTASVCRSLVDDVRRHFLPDDGVSGQALNTTALESLLEGISVACSRMESLASACSGTEDEVW